MNYRFPSLLLAFSPFFCASLATGVTIDTVPVGNAGNADDRNYIGTRLGAVPYVYRIGTYEVTNSQYAEFLNAKAKSDALALYNTNMGSNARGGIVRSDSSPNFSYAAKENMGDKPVNYVSFYDSVRFANWLNNGQGAGSTEFGAYTISGGTPTPSSVSDRNAGASWFLPTHDEWYKAAFYDARTAAQGGPPGDNNYWLYPTQSDSAPTEATANSVGGISNPGVNVANFNHGADWNGQDGNVTTVGSAGLLSLSFYGTSDQAGNVVEWNGGGPTFTTQVVFNGSWFDSANTLSSSGAGAGSAAIEAATIGFRVAAVPEPSTGVLGMLGLIALAAARWRRRW